MMSSLRPMAPIVGGNTAWPGESVRREDRLQGAGSRKVRQSRRPEAGEHWQKSHLGSAQVDQPAWAASRCQKTRPERQARSAEGAGATAAAAASGGGSGLVPARGVRAPRARAQPALVLYVCAASSRVPARCAYPSRYAGASHREARTLRDLDADAVGKPVKRCGAAQQPAIGSPTWARRAQQQDPNARLASVSAGDTPPERSNNVSGVAGRGCPARRRPLHLSRVLDLTLAPPHNPHDRQHSRLPAPIVWKR